MLGHIKGETVRVPATFLLLENLSPDEFYANIAQDKFVAVAIAKTALEARELLDVFFADSTTKKSVVNEYKLNKSLPQGKMLVFVRALNSHYALLGATYHTGENDEGYGANVLEIKLMKAASPSDSHGFYLADKTDKFPRVVAEVAGFKRPHRLKKGFLRKLSS